MYKNKGKFVQRCCLTPGKYILTCETNDLAMGWRNAKILVDGHSYCDDFFSHKAMRLITVTGIMFHGVYLTIKNSFFFCTRFYIRYLFLLIPLPAILNDDGNTNECNGDDTSNVSITA